MLDWINFFFFIFFFSIFFLFKSSNNFLNLFFFGEFFWCILYSLFLVLGVYVDDINLISFSFFILAFAAAEFSLGYILLLNFKTVKESYFLKKNKKNINLRSSSDLLSSINSFFWNK